MKSNSSNNLNLGLTIKSDDSNINDYLEVYKHFGKRPNKLILRDNFSGKDFNDIIEQNFKEFESFVISEYIPTQDTYNVNEKILLRLTDEIYISFFQFDSNSENFFIGDVIIYYKDKSNIEVVSDICNKICDCVVDYEADNFSKLNSLQLINSSLELDPIQLEQNCFDDFDLCYNSKTIKSIDKLIKNIKKKNNGISIFYGNRGLGKTNAMKYVSSKLDRVSIFIPINMVDLTINNPEFKNFIKRFDKCLLIIDDCEALSPNFLTQKNSYYSSNILQLVDGFLANTFNIQVLLCYNVESEDYIDENLLESNSLVDVIEFDYLEKDLAQELSNKLGFNKKYKTDVKLSDVFSNKVNKDKQIKIGL